MRLLVSGSRHLTSASREDVRLALVTAAGSHDKVTLIHGAARGLDRLADDIAAELGWSVMRFPAEWERYGKSAGRMRNVEMVATGAPDRVVAFPCQHSIGTRHMIRYARECGIAVMVRALDCPVVQPPRPPRPPWAWLRAGIVPD